MLTPKTRVYELRARPGDVLARLAEAADIQLHQGLVPPRAACAEDEPRYVAQTRGTSFRITLSPRHRSGRDPGLRGPWIEASIDRSRSMDGEERCRMVCSATSGARTEAIHFALVCGIIAGSGVLLAGDHGWWVAAPFLITGLMGFLSIPVSLAAQRSARLEAELYNRVEHLVRDRVAPARSRALGLPYRAGQGREPAPGA